MLLAMNNGGLVSIAEEGPRRGGFVAFSGRSAATADELKVIDVACEAANQARSLDTLEGRVGPWHGAQRQQRVVLRQLLRSAGLGREAVTGIDSQGGTGAFDRVPFEALPPVDHDFWMRASQRHPITE